MKQHFHPKRQDKHILHSVRGAEKYAVSNARRQRLDNLLLIIFGFNHDAQKVVVVPNIIIIVSERIIRTNRIHYLFSIYFNINPTLPTASQHKRMTYTNCCIHREVPPDDEQ
jgi:hypothetical protein